jgi:hypothetical protein
LSDYSKFKSSVDEDVMDEAAVVVTTIAGDAAMSGGCSVQKMTCFTRAHTPQMGVANSTAFADAAVVGW